MGQAEGGKQVTTRATYPKCATCSHYRIKRGGYPVCGRLPSEHINTSPNFGCILHSSLDAAQAEAPASYAHPDSQDISYDGDAPSLSYTCVCGQPRGSHTVGGGRIDHAFRLWQLAPDEAWESALKILREGGADVEALLKQGAANIERYGEPSAPAIPDSSARAPNYGLGNVQIDSVWRDIGLLRRERKVVGFGPKGEPTTQDLTEPESPNPYTWSSLEQFLKSHSWLSDPPSLPNSTPAVEIVVAPPSQPAASGGEPYLPAVPVIRAAEGVTLERVEYEIVEVDDLDPNLKAGDVARPERLDAVKRLATAYDNRYGWLFLDGGPSTWVTAVRRVSPVTPDKGRADDAAQQDSSGSQETGSRELARGAGMPSVAATSGGPDETIAELTLQRDEARAVIDRAVFELGEHSQAISLPAAIRALRTQLTQAQSDLATAAAQLKTDRELFEARDVVETQLRREVATLTRERAGWRERAGKWGQTCAELAKDCDTVNARCDELARKLEEATRLRCRGCADVIKTENPYPEETEHG